MSRNILFIQSGWYPSTKFGGPVVSSKILFEIIQRHGEVASVLTTNLESRKGTKTIEVESDRDILRIDFSRGRLYGKMVFLFQLIPSVQDAKVIVLTGVFDFYTIPTLLVSRFFRKRLIWSTRGAIQALVEFKEVNKPLGKKIYLALANLLISSQTTVLATLESEKRCNLKFIRRGFHYIVPNTSNFQPKYLSDNVSSLCFISRLDSKKGITEFLEFVRSYYGNFHSVNIAGEGDKIILDKVTLAESQIVNVKYWGSINDSEKKRFFLKSGIMYFPSKSENFGIVILEALKAGVSVVTTIKDPWELHAKSGVLHIVDSDEKPEGILKVINEVKVYRSKRLSYVHSECIKIASAFGMEKTEKLFLKLITK